MKSHFNPTLLSEDILQLKSGITDEKLKMERLCRDHNSPYVLPDGEAILNITQDELIEFFNYSSNHYFLESYQAFRLGQFFNVDTTQAIALMLKSDWEIFLCEHIESTEKLSALLKNDKTIGTKIKMFSPDKKQYIALFNKYKWSLSQTCNTNRIEYMMQDLIEDNKFLSNITELKNLYTSDEKTESIFLKNLNDKQRVNFNKLKETWLNNSIQLEDLLFKFEKLKRISMNLEDKYYRSFGKYEIKIVWLSSKLEKYKIALNIIETTPDLSYRQLLRKAEENYTNLEDHKKSILEKIYRSINCIGGNIEIETQPISVSVSVKREYEDKCKKLLKRLYHLMRPDLQFGLNRSKTIKSKLKILWNRLKGTDQSELISYSPNLVLFHMPDYDTIYEIYQEVCEILNEPLEFENIENRLEFMIQKGSNYDEIIDFLKSEIIMLEDSLSYLEMNQNEYTSEEQSLNYHEALQDPDNHIQNLKQKIDELKTQMLRIKENIIFLKNKHYEH